MMTTEEINTIRRACGLRTEGSEAHELLDRLERASTTIAVKTVLSNGEGDEYELGPFNQGVVFETRHGHTSLVDVATSRPVAQDSNGTWITEGPGPFARLYVTGVEA